MSKKNGKKDKITTDEIRLINSKDGLLELLRSKEINVDKLLDKLRYEDELESLQEELVKLQNWVQDKNQKVIIVFEGRDAAGKGGAIQRFTKYLSPRFHRVVALSKPTLMEQGQWYFQRYVQQLPTDGEIVLFDRSWYNRAVVEPVNGFCNEEQYERFMEQVNRFEKMLIESGIILIKFWLDIDKEEQIERFADRRENPLKQWKISPVDARAQELWDKYTHYKNLMLERSHTELCPWVVIDANDKKKTRIETLRYVLSKIDYEQKKNAKISFKTDSKVVCYAPEHLERMNSKVSK